MVLTVWFPVRSSFSPATVIFPLPSTFVPLKPAALLVYRAAVASWATPLRTTSLLLLPEAVTRSAYLPAVEVRTALVKKLELSRLVEEV